MYMGANRLTGPREYSTNEIRPLSCGNFRQAYEDGLRAWRDALIEGFICTGYSALQYNEGTDP
jgi:hypothetical protein